LADSRNIGDPDGLAEIAQSVGLPADEARVVLDERRFKDAVDADWAKSHRYGVTRVPTFVAGGHGVVEQPLLELGIGPGAGNDAGANMRPDPGLGGLDDLIQRGRSDIALLGQDRLQRAHPQLHVGHFRAVIVVVLMVFVFFIGSEQKIFARKNEYVIHLPDAAGLAEGNPVKISGVTVGAVRDIYLPRDPKSRTVDITLTVDRKYADRIRTDSRVRLKKLGLLSGDSYVDITPGTPKFDVLEPGSTILAARQTNVDQLLSSGEDLVDNLVQISYSMKNILARVDRAEGLIGELTTSPGTKQRTTHTLLTTHKKTQAMLAHVESGKGLLGKLVYDDAYATQLTASIASTAESLRVVSANVQKNFESGKGAIPALLADPEGKKKVYDLVDNLRTTSANLAAFSATMQNGQGIVPRLMTDKAYADQALTQFNQLATNLNQTVMKINNGEGTAGKIINDPSIYESINDILIGINESKMLRWLIRNRQERGIDTRVKTEQKAPPPSTPPASAPATSTTAPPTTKSENALPPTSTAPPPYWGSFRAA